LSAEQVEAYRVNKAERAEADTVEVLAANWDAVQVFQRCGWQVVSVGMAGQPIYVGVQAQEVQTVARALRVRLTEELLDDVRAIAATVREVWNKPRS
jgi:hypothetical protein